MTASSPAWNRLVSTCTSVRLQVLMTSASAIDSCVMSEVANSRQASRDIDSCAN